MTCFTSSKKIISTEISVQGVSVIKAERFLTVESTMKLYMILCCFLVLVSQADFTKQYLRVVGQEVWVYVVDDDVDFFDETVSWCHSMGGQLPFIHTQEDIDFLADHLDDQTRSVFWHYFSVWIGLRKTNGTCDRFLDGSLVNITFDFYVGVTCSRFIVDDVALTMVGGKGPLRAKFDLQSVKLAFRRVCVIKVNQIEDTFRNQVTLLAPQTKALLVIKLLSVIVVIQTLGLVYFVFKKRFREITEQIILRHPIRGVADTSSQLENYERLS